MLLQFKSSMLLILESLLYELTVHSEGVYESLPQRPSSEKQRFQECTYRHFLENEIPVLLEDVSFMARYQLYF